MPCSQDFEAWEERYNENEAHSKNTVRSEANKNQNNPVVIEGKLLFPLIKRNITDTSIWLTVFDDDDDYGYDEEYDDESSEEYLDDIDCSDALVEHARSGRSRCILCNELISNGSLRFGVTRYSDVYGPTTAFLHLACGRDYNTSRRVQNANVISLVNLRNYRNLSRSDQRLVDASL